MVVQYKNWDQIVSLNQSIADCMLMGTMNRDGVIAEQITDKMKNEIAPFLMIKLQAIYADIKKSHYDRWLPNLNHYLQSGVTDLNYFRGKTSNELLLKVPHVLYNVPANPMNVVRPLGLLNKGHYFNQVVLSEKNFRYAMGEILESILILKDTDFISSLDVKDWYPENLKNIHDEWFFTFEKIVSIYDKKSDKYREHIKYQEKIMNEYIDVLLKKWNEDVLETKEQKKYFKLVERTGREDLLKVLLDNYAKKWSPSDKLDLNPLLKKICKKSIQNKVLLIPFIKEVEDFDSHEYFDEDNDSFIICLNTEKILYKWKTCGKKGNAEIITNSLSYIINKYQSSYENEENIFHRIVNISYNELGHKVMIIVDNYKDKKISEENLKIALKEFIGNYIGNLYDKTKPSSFDMNYARAITESLIMKEMTKNETKIQKKSIKF